MPDSHSRRRRGSLSSAIVVNVVPPANPSRTDALARYDALLSISRQLAHHRSISELVHVLADHLHVVVPFDYLALVLHEAPTEQMRLLVLAPPDLPRPPTDTMPVAAGGPAARVWQSQQATVIPIPPTGPLVPALDFIRGLGQKITCWLPLTTANARVGVLTFGSSCETDYGEDAIAFMEQVAAHVAVAVDNAINLDRAETLARELAIERDRLQLLLEV